MGIREDWNDKILVFDGGMGSLLQGAGLKPGELPETWNIKHPEVLVKIHEDYKTVCSIADELIREYKGVYCIESFNPHAVKWYKEHRPDVIRGQLSSRLAPKGEREPFLYMMSHYLLFNCVAKPDFIAYDHLHKGHISRTLCQKLYHALSVAWTIKSQKQLDASRKQFDLFIFEGFIPKE